MDKQFFKGSLRQRIVTSLARVYGACKLQLAQIYLNLHLPRASAERGSGSRGRLTPPGLVNVHILTIQRLNIGSLTHGHAKKNPGDGLVIYLCLSYHHLKHTACSCVFVTSLSFVFVTSLSFVFVTSVYTSLIVAVADSSVFVTVVHRSVFVTAVYSSTLSICQNSRPYRIAFSITYAVSQKRCPNRLVGTLWYIHTTNFKK